MQLVQVPPVRSLPPLHGHPQNRAVLVSALQVQTSGIRNFGVSCFGVFGSFARDAVTDQRDVDLLVEFEEGRKTLKNLVGLAH